MSIQRRATSLLFYLIAASYPALAIQVTVPMHDTPPIIDGKISPEERKAAAAMDMTKIGALEKPRYPTQVYTMATVDGIYFAFDVTEPDMDTLVTSTTQNNGAVFQDDSVQVLLTPTLDTSPDNYFHFAVNPEGIYYSNDLSTGEFVTDWKTAVTKTGVGWQAEFFIPLTAIRAPYELPHWRANFARVRPARAGQPEEISAWVNSGISLHNYKRFGYLTTPRFVGPAPESNKEFTTAPVEIISTTPRTLN